MKRKKLLIANKELFRVWYEFYRLALNSKDPLVVNLLKKSSSYYKDWGNDPHLHFDDWWKIHRHLFLDENKVKIYSEGDSMKKGSLYLEIPPDKSFTDLIDEIGILLTKELSRLKKGRKLPPVHRYAPTEIQGLKWDSIRMMLDLQKNVFCDSSLKGMTLREAVISFFSSARYKKKLNTIPYSFRINIQSLNDDHLDETDRNIRRYRQKASKLILNVASGIFPGKY